MATSSPNSSLLLEVLRDVGTAIGKEIAAGESDPSTQIDLRDGQPKGSVGADRLWSFDCDGSTSIPPESPGVLHISGREPIAATVIATGDLDVLIGVREELGEVVERATLSIDPSFIYGRLRGRLDSYLQLDLHSPMAEALLDLDELDDTEPSVAGSAMSDVSEQLAASHHSSEGGLRFVWGPPGTGKTRVLAEAVALAVRRGERVTVVAHSNVAVDVAMVRIAEVLADDRCLADGRVLRVGLPQTPEALRCHSILPHEILRAKFPDLIRELEAADEERSSIRQKMRTAETAAETRQLAFRLESVRDTSAELERRVREAQASLVENAVVVGATLSKVVLDDQLWNWPADLIAVDEASMAGLPFALGLALRGPGGLAFFGDFRQLPPIAVSSAVDAQQWFGRDVFELAGVVDRIERGEPDGRLSTLRTQYRMGRHIADVVSDFAYFGMLRTDPSADDRAQLLAQAAPVDGTAVVVVDTSSLGAVCLREASVGSFSRFNPLSGALSVQAASLALASGATDIGLITPYRAQAQLLRALTRGLAGVSAATVHKFQGGERDVVILDLTDGRPQQGPSRLTGSEDDLARRLLNVSVSRARGKLVVLADLGFLGTRHPPASMTNKLVELLISGGANVIAPNELIDPAPMNWYPDWPAAVEALGHDHPGPARIEVGLPDETFAGEWLDAIVNRSPIAIVRAPYSVARRISRSDVDIRLKTLGEAPMIFIDGSRVVVGGAEPSSPAVQLDGGTVQAVLRRLLVSSE